MASSAMLTTTATATETSLAAATETPKAPLPTTTTPTITAASTVAATSAVSTALLENDDDECKDDDVLNTSLHSCANDPDFAVICAFLQKFAKELGLDLPNFKRLQEWLTNTDEVAAPIRDLHIKLLRKTRKTVHEKSWESAVSKFCFTYSAQDGWEVERFGYKQASLKVKLRILRELLESQFERNNKFRNKILTLSADSLRSQPIGRDRLGHSYWLTQDSDCNLRIYQEHLDEEIWQVVATNRDEFVNLIARLRGNEVVLPSTDIGVIDEDTSSSSSCNIQIEKPPPPVEQDDSQEDEAKVVPNLRLKLGEGGAYHSAGKYVGKGEEELAAEEDKKLEQRKIQQHVATKARNTVEEEEEEAEAEAEEEAEEEMSGEEEGEEGEEAEEEGEEEVDSAEEDQSADEVEDNDSEPVLEKGKEKNTIPIVVCTEETQKKVKPLLISHAKIASSIALQHAASSNGSSKKRALDEVDKTSPRSSDDNNTNAIKKFRPSLLDSKRDKKPSKYEKAKSDEEDDEEDDEDDDDGSEEEDEADIDDDEGEEEDIDSAAAEEDENEEKDIEEDDDDDDEVGEAIEDPPIIVRGEGSGKQCDGANPEFLIEFSLLDDSTLFLSQDDDPEPEVGEAIEEEYLYINGEGNGAECLVGNKNNEDSPSTPPATTTTTSTEPKATFFFGEPGCLKLSPIKKSSTKDTDARSNDGEIEDELTTDISENNKEQQDGELTTAESVGLKNAINSDKNEERNKDKNIKKLEEQYHENSKDKIQEICEKTNDDNIAKINESLNENNMVKFESVEVSEKNDVNTENILNDNLNHNNQGNIKENNTTMENEKNKLELNNKFAKQAVAEESIANSSEANVEALELNGLGNNEVCTKDKERNKIKKLPTSDTDTQRATNENEALDVSKEIHENIANIIKVTEEPQEKPTKSEMVQKNEKESKNLVPQDVKTTNVKTVIIKEETDLPEKVNKSSEETTEKLTKPKLTDAHLTHIEALNKTNEAAALNDTKTLTQLVAIPQKCALSEKTATEDAPITAIATASLTNRKRRLADFTEIQKPKMRPQTTSESEVELPEEPFNLAANDDPEDDAGYVGGKRLKMRSKLTNTEIRKKVEAQKIAAVEETTSSSGEEEALRKRKIISPKRQLVGNKSNKIELPKKSENEPHTTLAEIKEEIAVQIVAPVIPLLVKQKPTLAEIIEKKLKKTPEKPVKILAEDASTSSEAAINTASTSTSAPFKKSPITKPLKKNLLTQLRQEESDEEAIPRKRIIGETEQQNIRHRQNTPPPGPVSSPTTQKLPSDEQQKVEQLTRGTPERITPDRQRKRRSSEEVQHPELTDHSPNNDCVGEKLKKNNADEIASTIKELKVESIPLTMKRLESTEEEQIFKQTPPPEITSLEILAKPEEVESTGLDTKTEVKDEEITTGLGGRRSGRRGGTAVIYAELPQPKRTRGGPKATPAAPATSKQEETKPKMDATEIKPKEETLTETKKPQVNSEAKKSGTTESKEVKPEPEDTPFVPQKPPTKSKPVKTSPKARGRKKREVDTTNIIESADSETPVRQSRRIAQQKIREEAERRKLEEIALRTMKNELKKKKKAEAQADPSVPEPSEQSSSSDESEVSLIEEETKKLKKKKCPGKDGTWSSGSEEQEEPEEEEEPPHYETDPGSPLFKSDHEFSPESDLEDESQVVPMKRARTARKEDAELSDLKQLDQEEEACQKCGKSDHPEWILLCDSCDKGYHCSCLSPVLFYIPEGDWYCPPCQQEHLIVALEKQLQEFDFLVKQKRIEEEQAQRLAEEAIRAENERLEEEKRKKKKKKQRGDDESSDNDADESTSVVRNSDKESDDDDEDGDEKSLKNKDKKTKKNQSNDKRKQRRDIGGHRRRRRRAATRGARRRRRNASKSGGSAGSDENGGSGSQSGTDSESSSDGSSSSSSATDSDDEPIYKLRKRRQINVSYRLNEYDDLINSALKKEMDEAAIAGNLGRGKDITTIIEADKEEQARQKQLVDGEFVDATELAPKEEKPDTNETKTVTQELVGGSDDAEVTTKVSDEQKPQVADDVDSEEEPLKRKAKTKQTLKKKPRKLTTLDISSEEDNASDEDFKGSSLDDDDDEDTSVSISSNSDSSLEIYRRRGKKGGKKKTRKAARRTARERRKVRKFVVDDSEDDEEEVQRPKTKKKRKTDSDYTESEESGELSELSENMDSADLCDDSSSSEDSDGAWRPSKRKKQRKSTAVSIARKSPKLKKPQSKKPKRVEYSDDDVSEDEEEDYEDEDDDPATGGKGSGKQPRTVPLKPSNSGKGKGKGKGGVGAGKSSKATTASKKKKKKLSDYDDDSFSDSEDSTRRTRGRRYAYLEDFEDDSSDGGIKPGVKRPDTPPEEREKFIKKQEEIKRMLAEKNAEGAKLAATPRLTPIKGGTRSPAKPGDSLSTVPLSVIRQAKVLDIDYLQRKGESVSDVDNVDDVDSEFDDADLPDDFPEDMDEDAIARMVEEEEEFGTAVATRELPAPDEVLKPAGAKAKPKDAEKSQVPPTTNASLVALSQMPSNAGSGQSTGFASGLQEPMRKRLPMPTMHPPLLRHQYPGGGQHHQSLPPHMMQRNSGPPTHLLQNALSAPLGQPVHRNFPHQTMGAQRGPPGGGMPPRHVLPPHALPPPQQQLAASHPLPGSGVETESKPRGRRKKITPLRDPLQKQQAAAAATAAAAVQAATTGNANEKGEASPPTSVATGVIKSATSLAIAQPPQLYKPSGGSSSAGQPSVITRMPHLPPHSAPPGRGMPLGPPGMYAGGDVARFYGPPMQQPSGAPGSRLPPAASQRHRGPPHAGSMPPHHGMRPSYGPPPPLRGVIGSSNSQPPNSVSGTRQPYPPPRNHGEHHGPQSAGPYGPPPPARHAAPHINPYRPSIFGNPNYGPRGAPPGASMRTTGSPGQEYPAGPPRSYAPYGYYPPPPPLTAAHPPSPSTHPPPSTTHAPATSKPPASTTRTSTSNTQLPAVPSSVIVSAPPSSISLTPSAAAAQKHAPRAVIKTAPAAADHNKLTPAVVVSPSAVVVEPRKKLITLETFATSKSPLALSGESSGSRSSPNVQPDGADDSTSTPAVATSGGNGQGASEFSGLVSYFSSQHDDYNT